MSINQIISNDQVKDERDFFASLVFELEAKRQKEASFAEGLARSLQSGLAHSKIEDNMLSLLSSVQRLQGIQGKITTAKAQLALLNKIFQIN